VIRATLDVNVLASAFPVTTGTPAELVARWANQEFEMILSDHIMRGLQRTWQKPYYRLNYSPERAQEAMHILRRTASFVVPDKSISNIAPDAEDDLVIATAIAGEVDFLVTGDKRLQALRQVRDVDIITPRAFLDVLEFEARRTI
jgi:putative PIN family toxin of toxin-antitoxin system